MILYTMMPHELIFPAEPDSVNRQQMVSYQGVSLIVEPADQNNVQVVRILSSDPNHYLDERLAPGTKISWSDIAGLSSF